MFQILKQNYIYNFMCCYLMHIYIYIKYASLIFILCVCGVCLCVWYVLRVRARISDVLNSTSKYKLKIELIKLIKIINKILKFLNFNT